MLAVLTTGTLLAGVGTALAADPATGGSPCPPGITAPPGFTLICGTAGPDVLIGTAGHDVIYGFEGNDTIAGQAGMDYIYAGPGANVVDGGPDNDFLQGGPDADVLTGGDGVDMFIGGGGADTFVDRNSWERFASYGPSYGDPAPAALPAGTAPTATLQVWDEQHATGQPGVSVPARVFLAEKLPHLGALIRRGLLPADAAAAYQAQQAVLDARVRSCGTQWGSEFRQWNPTAWPTPQWGRPGGTAAGNHWSDCLKGAAYVPGTNPPVVDTTWSAPVVCIDNPGTPYLDYDRCQSIGVHKKAPTSGTMPPRDRVVADWASSLMGSPTHDQIVNAIEQQVLPTGILGLPEATMPAPAGSGG